MKVDKDLCKNLWYELNPRVRCAFGNVFDYYLHKQILCLQFFLYKYFLMCWPLLQMQRKPKGLEELWTDEERWLSDKICSILDFGKNSVIGHFLRCIIHWNRAETRLDNRSVLGFRKLMIVMKTNIRHEKGKEKRQCRNWRRKKMRLSPAKKIMLQWQWWRRNWIY